MSGNSVILELSEQGKDTFTRNQNGDYLCTVAPQLIEKGDVIELKSAYIDSVSSSSGKCNIPPDVLGGDTATISMTFGYYAIDHDGSQEATAPSKTYADFPGQPTNHPNGKAYCLNEFESGTPSADAKKLVEFKIPFKASAKPQTINKRNDCFRLVLTLKKDKTEKEDDPSMFFYDYVFDSKFNNIPKYLDANGDMIFNDTLVSNMAKDGFIIGQAQGITQNLANYSDTPTVKELFPSDRNNIPFSRGGSVGFANVPTSITVEDFGNNEDLNRLHKKVISFEITAKSYDPHDLAELITDKLTNPLLEGALPADAFTISQNPLLTTARTLRNDAKFAGEAAQFFHPTQGRLSFNSTIAGGDADYFIGTSQFGLVYDDITDTFKFSSLHSSLYSTDPNEKTPAPLVEILSDGAGGKILLNKSGGIFFTELSPASIWIGQDSVFKFNPNIISTALPQSFDPGGGQNKINFETVVLEDGTNITGDLQGLDSLVQKQTLAPVAGSSPNGKGFDIVPSLPFSTATTQTISINAANGFTSNREAFFKLEIKLPNIRQKVFLNHLPPSTNGLYGETTINTDIQAIIGRYYSANNFTSSYNEGSIPYVYNEDEPTILSEVQIRILDPDGTVATGLGNKNTIFLQIQKNTNNI